MKNLALSPEAIGRALFRENVLGVLLREIQRNTEISFDQQDLAEAIQGMLTPEAREVMAPPRVRRDETRDEARVEAAPADARERIALEPRPVVALRSAAGCGEVTNLRRAFPAHLPGC